MGTLLLIIFAFVLGMVFVIAAARPISRMLQPKPPESAVARWMEHMNMLRLIGYEGMSEDEKQWYLSIITCLNGDRLYGKKLSRLTPGDIAWIIEGVQTLDVSKRIPTNIETVKAAIKRIADAQAKKQS